MNSPTNFLRTAVPVAVKAGKAIMEIYSRPTEEWHIELKQDNSPLTLADETANKIINECLLPTNIPIVSEENLCVDYSERKQWKQLWMVDPLDGTKDFIKRNGEFTVNIALIEDGVPVAGVIFMPAKHTLYYGVQGFGSFRLGDITVAKDERQLIRSSVRLPMEQTLSRYTVVASRSHLNEETDAYIQKLRHEHPDLDMVSAGSSIKLCKVVEGSANIYPRLAPSMEWDTAAGDAIARATGCQVLNIETGDPLLYNKEDLHNPHFVVIEAKK